MSAVAQSSVSVVRTRQRRAKHVVGVVLVGDEAAVQVLVEVDEVGERVLEHGLDGAAPMSCAVDEPTIAAYHSLAFSPGASAPATTSPSTRHAGRRLGRIDRVERGAEYEGMDEGDGDSLGPGAAT